MKKILVLINIYKSELTRNEILSLKKCIKTLYRHEIIFLGPNDIDLSVYKNLAPEINFHLTDAKCFKGWENYSKFLFSEELYSSFQNYDYILIYQLDCYVFKDELEYWASLDYDYIGAPMFKDFYNNKTFEIIGSGVGGLSLRNPSKILNILKNWEKNITYSGIIKDKLAFTRSEKINLIIHKFISSLTGYSFHRPIVSFLNEPVDDIIFGLYLGKELELLNIPTPLIASKFSFEMHPEILYKINNQSLPFGCHAWERFDLKFWSNFIEQDVENFS
jgi:hypothetical protein